MARTSYIQWNGDDICFVLDQHPELAFYSALVLAHRNNNPQVDMLSHSDTLSWLQANQSLLLLLNAGFLAEEQQIPFL